MHPIRALAIAIVAVVLIAGCGSDNRSSTSPSSASDGLVDIGEGLRGPATLHATTYASGITHATAMAFDGEGRLWVATADYTDSGNDGVYVVDRAGAALLPVITGLHTALGLVWSGDTLFVSSKERVDAYSGFDGTRFQSQHNVVTFPAGVGEVNGLVLAPDGRFQLGISAPCDHCVPTSELSGAVVSFLPDGTDLRVDASRIRAPIGLAYQPGTNDLYVSMNQRDDLGDQTPGDWLSIVRTGQSWGFPDCYGQGGSVVLRRAAARRRARPARGGERGRDRHGAARRAGRHRCARGGVADRHRGPCADRSSERCSFGVPDRRQEPVRRRHRPGRGAVRRRLEHGYDFPPEHVIVR